MIDELRDRIKVYLGQHRLGVITTSGTIGAWAAPFWQYNLGLVLIALLPPWSDVIYHIEQNPMVQIVILDPQSSSLRWLQLRGMAHPMEAADWLQIMPAGFTASGPEKRYTAIRVVPQRIDLFDESQGWGARETLEF